MYLTKQNPLEQGLKRLNCGDMDEYTDPYQAKSIRTRIETGEGLQDDNGHGTLPSKIH